MYQDYPLSGQRIIVKRQDKMKLLRQKVNNEVTTAVEDTTSITLTSNNTFWFEHADGTMYTIPQSGLYDLIENITLPDEYENRKFILTQNDANEWVWEENPNWGKLQAFKVEASSKGPKDTQPFASWTFDEDVWEWVPPTAKPSFSEGKETYWDEDTTQWVEQDIET